MNLPVDLSTDLFYTKLHLKARDIISYRSVAIAPLLLITGKIQDQGGFSKAIKLELRCFLLLIPAH
jgi:hypothetical protein